MAWNIATGLYYKTQPEPPWKLAHVRPGVCYIGLVFKLIPNNPKQHANPSLIEMMRQDGKTLRPTR